MKQSVSLLILLLVCTALPAQNLKNFYLQNLHAEGLLYFVLPRAMNELNDGKRQCSRPLQYDYTYLDARDSVTLLLTVTTTKLFKADSLHITLPDGSSCQYGVESIYYQSVKKYWECRLRCVISYHHWEAMYRLPQPFVWTLLSNKTPAAIRFTDKPGKWKHLSACFVRLHDIIRLNKEK